MFGYLSEKSRLTPALLLHIQLNKVCPFRTETFNPANHYNEYIIRKIREIRRLRIRSFGRHGNVVAFTQFADYLCGNSN